MGGGGSKVAHDHTSGPAANRPNDHTSGPAANRPNDHTSGPAANQPNDQSQVAILSTLDGPLIKVLEEGDIRLLRAKWLNARPEGYIMERRQDLEELQFEMERCGGLTPFVSCTEAVELIRNGKREVGALSYGWILPWNPDPTGERTNLLRQELSQRSYIKALFWDQATLYQPPRDETQQKAFERALDAMMDLYASAVGTTVLQIKELPPRPAEYDGLLCLGKVPEGIDEAALKAKLQQFGEIASCAVPEGPIMDYRVKFEVHRAAEQACSAAPMLGLCKYAFIAYRDYDLYNERGWCVCEEELCTELLARLAVFPKMKSTLDSRGLPPKLLSLTTGKPTEVVQLHIQSAELQGRVNQVVARVGTAKFTNEKDKTVVLNLYESYVEKIASKLQETLALSGGGDQMHNDSAGSSGLSAAVAVRVASLHPANGQLLLLPTVTSRSDEGIEGALKLCQAEGQRLRRALAPQRKERVLKKQPTGARQLQQAEAQTEVGKPTFDGCSQQVLPWRPPTTCEGDALMRLLGVLRDLNTQSQDASKSATKLLGALRDLKTQIQGASNKSATDAAASAAEELKKIHDDASQLSPPLVEAIGHAERELLKGRVRVDQLVDDWVDDIAVPLLRAAGAIGWRRYDARQELTIRGATGRWTDVEVVGAEEPHSAKHRLRTHELGESVLELHPWNHALRELPSPDFQEALDKWKELLRKDHAHIFDAVLGRPLDVLEQCVTIDVLGDAADLAGVKDVGALSARLHSLHQQQCEGHEATKPTAALLTGPPAAGKTSLLNQLIMHTLNQPDAELVPILVKAQVLQRRLVDQPDAFATAWNWIDAFLRLELMERGASTYRMLRQAMASRRALILLDGLDEGGEKRKQIEQHVTKVLAPQGHVLLATSRPNGIDEKQYAGFHRFKLKPLSVEQQQQALEQRLGAEQARVLLPYLKRMPLDDETQERITANPLMLSMVASIFELRSGLANAMPDSVVDLYKQATGAMLGRAGNGSVSSLAPLLQAVFFEAHAANQRIITKEHLDAAARRVDDGKSARERLEKLVLEERMPLLSLLQASPLKLQSTHLSFQEFYAARAICKGSSLPKPREGSSQPKPCWELPVFWANAVKLGLDMGVEFGKGLLQSHSAALIGRGSVRVTLGGDQRTSALALGAALRAAEEVTEVSVGHAKLPLKKLREASATGKASATGLLTVVDLSKSAVGELDLVIVAGFFRAEKPSPIKLVLAQTSVTPAGMKMVAPLVTRLDIIGSMTDSKMHKLGDALLACKQGYLGSLSCNAFALPEDRSVCNLSIDGIKLGPAVLLAGVMKFNDSLTKLFLQFKNTFSEPIEDEGDKGAAAIADALHVNGSLTKLHLDKNEISEAGAAAIAEALKVNGSLKALSLYSNKIGDAGAAAIAEALKVNGSLKELNLNSNGLGPEAGVAIAEALKVKPPLTTLDLQYNRIGAAGASAVAEALKVKGSLTMLDLIYNEIGDTGATAIADSLYVNSSLKELHLAYNQFGDIGATAVANALRVNGSLSRLGLSGNNIEDASAMADAICFNGSLTRLDLHYNNLDAAAKTSLKVAASTKSGVELQL